MKKLNKAAFYLFALPVLVFCLRAISWPNDELSAYLLYILLAIWMILLARYFANGFK